MRFLAKKEGGSIGKPLRHKNPLEITRLKIQTPCLRGSAERARNRLKRGNFRAGFSDFKTVWLFRCFISCFAFLLALARLPVLTSLKLSVQALINCLSRLDSLALQGHRLLDQDVEALQGQLSLKSLDARDNHELTRKSRSGLRQRQRQPQLALLRGLGIQCVKAGGRKAAVRRLSRPIIKDL